MRFPVVNHSLEEDVYFINLSLLILYVSLNDLISLFVQLLLFRLLPPPPLFHAPPSSSHGVIQWKISTVNLSAYRFSILTTL